METPKQPREARLIDVAQKSAIPSLSMRKAAQAAGISDGRWRQIVKGYQGTGTGRIPVVAPGDTLARMALVVGVTPDQLDEAERPDAAVVLRHLLATSEQPDVELGTVSTDRLLNEIRRRIERNSNEDQDPQSTQGDSPADGEAGTRGTPMKLVPAIDVEDEIEEPLPFDPGEELAARRGDPEDRTAVTAEDDDHLN